MIDEKKKPPLVKAAREFIVGIQLVRQRIGNKGIALLVHALLSHAKGICAGAEEVTCSPSEQQLADLMWCSPRDVRRAISRARAAGILTIKRRGDGMSSVFTVHRKPISDRTTVGHSETEFRPDNSPPQTGQLSGSDRTTLISDRTTLVSDRTTVGHSETEFRPDNSPPQTGQLSGSDRTTLISDRTTLVSDRTTVGHSETEFRPDNSPPQTGQLSGSDRTTLISDRTTLVSDRTTVGHLRGKASGFDPQGRSPSGVELQAQSTESKANSLSPASQENQKPKSKSRALNEEAQRYEKLKNSPEVTRASTLLCASMGLTGVGDANRAVATQAIAHVVAQSADCSVADAVSVIESKVAKDKAAGVRMDIEYLLLQVTKVRVSEELCKPGRLASAP